MGPTSQDWTNLKKREILLTRLVTACMRLAFAYEVSPSGFSTASRWGDRC